MRTRAIDRTFLYRSADGDRHEHARLRSSDAGGIADGAIIGLLDGQPLRVRYEITCDSRWHARNVSVEAIATTRELLSMSADDDGTWRRVDGVVLDVPIYRCYDVAIAHSPTPMALTIRRLALEPNAVAIVNVATIDVPSMTIRATEHRYTCLEIAEDFSRYRFENFDSGERAEIRIDSDGAIAEYEERYARLWPTA